MVVVLELVVVLGASVVVVAAVVSADVDDPAAASVVTDVVAAVPAAGEHAVATKAIASIENGKSRLRIRALECTGPAHPKQGPSPQSLQDRRPTLR